MKKGIIAKKIGMTQIFNEDGLLIPVTVLQAGPCYVTRVKTIENDGYEAVQLGFDEVREKLINKPVRGHLDKAGIQEILKDQQKEDSEKNRPLKLGLRLMKEFKFENSSEYELGQVVKADIFSVGDKIDVTGKSKGKGFQGAIKRHGQHRGPMTHGSKYHRHAGSNGAASDPSRVFKGKKMPGQMGAVKVTVQNLEIVRIDVEDNLILVKGAVPGPRKSAVVIKESVKAI